MAWLPKFVVDSFLNACSKLIFLLLDGTSELLLQLFDAEVFKFALWLYSNLALLAIFYQETCLVKHFLSGIDGGIGAQCQCYGRSLVESLSRDRNTPSLKP